MFGLPLGNILCGRGIYVALVYAILWLSLPNVSRSIAAGASPFAPELRVVWAYTQQQKREAAYSAYPSSLSISARNSFTFSDICAFVTFALPYPNSVPGFLLDLSRH